MSCSFMPSSPVGPIQGTHGREGGGATAAFAKLCESPLLVEGILIFCKTSLWVGFGLGPKRNYDKTT